MKLNEKIEKLRIDNGLSQQDLADKVFVSRQAVQKWEKGKSQPSIDVLKLLSKLFNVTVDYLITDDEPEVVESVEDKEFEKTEKTSEKSAEIPNKKKKHTGLKITLGILIPALVIGGGVLAIKLVKDAKQKAYDETFGTRASTKDFDIRTQIIPDVNNVAIQVIPKYDVKDVKCNITIYADLLREFNDTKTYASLSAGQLVTFEYSYSEISSSLYSRNPQDALVLVSGTKQNKYKDFVEPINDYSGIGGGYATYNTVSTIDGIVPYITSTYDGLIYGGSDLKIVYKYNNSTLVVSAVSFATSGPHYLRKGETLQIKGRFNTEVTGSPGSGTFTYEFDHIESGKILYGPKCGKGSINLDRNEEILTGRGIEKTTDGKYKVYLNSMVDIESLFDIRIFVMEKGDFTSVVEAYEKLGDFRNLNLKAYNNCYFVTTLSEEVVKYASQGYPIKFKGYADVPFEINEECEVICKDIVDGNEQNFRKYITLPGCPLSMPTIKEYSGKSIKGFYEDKELTKLVDFTSVATERYTYIYAKVK